MRLIVECASCGKHVRVASRDRSRLALVAKLGREVKVPCNSCGAEETYELDDVYAVDGYLPVIVAIAVFGISIVLTLYLWDLGWVSTLTLILPAGVYWAFRTDEESRITAFNRSEVGRIARSGAKGAA